MIWDLTSVQWDVYTDMGPPVLNHIQKILICTVNPLPEDIAAKEHHAEFNWNRISEKPDTVPLSQHDSNF